MEHPDVGRKLPWWYQRELADAAGMAHLLKYDTQPRAFLHGRFATSASSFVGDDVIHILHERTLADLRGAKTGRVDVVLVVRAYMATEHGGAHIAAGEEEMSLFSSGQQRS